MTSALRAREGRRRWATICAAAVVVLAGCRVDTAVDVRIDRTGKGQVSVTITADPELVQAAPRLAEDIRIADLAAAGWSVDGPAPAEGGGLTLVLSRPFATPDEAVAVLAQLSGSGGPLRNLAISQETGFARVTTSVSGSIRLEGGLAAFVDTATLAKLGADPYAGALAARGLRTEDVFGLELSITAPGQVRSTDGVLDPGVDSTTGAEATSTARWTADVAGAANGRDQPVNLEVRLSNDSARQARRWRDFAPWAAAAWLAFFAGVVLPIVALVRRARRP